MYEHTHYTHYYMCGNFNGITNFVLISFHYYKFQFFKHSINFHINTLEHDRYEKMSVHYPRPTYCEFINTSHRKHVMKTVHSPISSDPYSDDRNDDLCYSFRSEHNVRSADLFNFRTIIAAETSS